MEKCGYLSVFYKQLVFLGLNPAEIPSCFPHSGQEKTFSRQIMRVNFAKPESYPHSIFIRLSDIINAWRNAKMNYESFETKLIQKQNIYIRQLEEQIKVYQEKDKAQELLIEKLNQALELLSEELSRVKPEQAENVRKEE